MTTYAAAYTKKGNKGIDEYQYQQIMSMSPEQLILKIYDIAIVSVKKGEQQRATRAVAELIGSLNFDYQEMALGLFRLYRYVQDKIRQNEKEEAIMILEELRSAWATAFNLT